MDFKHGDLVIKCHQCGGIEVIEPLVTDGRAIYLFNKKDSFLKLHCTVCNITMEMRMMPSEIPDSLIDEEDKVIDLEIENEELPQESTP